MLKDKTKESNNFDTIKSNKKILNTMNNKEYKSLKVVSNCDNIKKRHNNKRNTKITHRLRLRRRPRHHSINASADNINNNDINNTKNKNKNKNNRQEKRFLKRGLAKNILINYNNTYIKLQKEKEKDLISNRSKKTKSIKFKKPKKCENSTKSRAYKKKKIFDSETSSFEDLESLCSSKGKNNSDFYYSETNKSINIVNQSYINMKKESIELSKFKARLVSCCPIIR